MDGFKPKVLKVTSVKKDLAKIAKEYNVSYTPTINDYTTAVDIKDFPCQLLNAVSYSLYNLLPRKSITNVRIETDDTVLMQENVKARLEGLILDSKTELGPISAELVHRFKVPNPVFLTTRDFKSKKSGHLNTADNVPICCIGPGKFITIEADIVEDFSANNMKVFSEYIYSFDRLDLVITDETGKTYEECQGVEIEMNNGTFKFSYQDNVDGKEVLNRSIKLLAKFFEEVIKEENITVSISSIMLKMEFDGSAVLANLFKLYVYLAGDRKVFVNALATELPHSFIMVKNINNAEFRKLVEKAQKRLLADLNGLI